MKTIFAVLCAAFLSSPAACADEPGHKAQGSDQAQKGPPAKDQAAKGAGPDVLIGVEVEGPEVEGKVETVVACKAQAGKVVACDPEDMKNPTTGKAVLKEVGDRVAIDKAWKSKLNDAAGKTLDSAGEKAMVVKLKRLTAKLAYLKAAKKALAGQLVSAESSQPEAVDKIRSEKEFLENILNDSVTDCETLHRENFKKSVIDCKGALQAPPPPQEQKLPPAKKLPPPPQGQKLPPGKKLPPQAPPQAQP
ncbi:MAG: hypothetical protein NTY77_07745 [Elusimicrobia bacterium]|nr:hypothetical protein [Elusimicrobiota bacterium]